MTNQLAVLL
jgi:hypothetical protein